MPIIPDLSIEVLISLLTLTLMEIVLGIDNIVFISIITGKVRKEYQEQVRKWGILLAMLMRLVLLFFITWIITLSIPVFTIESDILGNNDAIVFSIKDLIMIAGGVFLLAKSTSEIHSKIEGMKDHKQATEATFTSYKLAIVQIILIDIVFSFDSILTAVGLVNEILIMMLAVVIALFIMLVFSKKVNNFVHRYPTIKMLALAFLLLIGVLLILEGFGHKIPKGYVYFAMGFSLMVELLNIRYHRMQRVKKIREERAARQTG